MVDFILTLIMLFVLMFCEFIKAMLWVICMAFIIPYLLCKHLIEKLRKNFNRKRQ